MTDCHACDIPVCKFVIPYPIYLLVQLLYLFRKADGVASFSGSLLVGMKGVIKIAARCPRDTDEAENEGTEIIIKLDHGDILIVSLLEITN